MPRIAIYPGSFDPLTNGHVSIVRRGLSIFDEIVVAVARNVRKSSSLFTLDERLDHLRHAFDGEAVRVETFDSLLVDYAKSIGASAILRGLRAVKDFEYELQMTHMNRKLAPEVETVFMMTEEDQSYVSSTLVKEVARFGGDVRPFVPTHVVDPLYDKLNQIP